MGIRQRETIKDLQADLETANDKIRMLREQHASLQARVDRVDRFVLNLFYLHPPLKKAYYGPNRAANLLLPLPASLEPKYEYVARLAEAKRNVETLNSADLAKIDRYLETVLEETSNE